MTTRRRTRPAITRRSFLASAAMAASGLAIGAGRPAWAQTGSAPAVVTRDPMRPQLPSGVMAGDVSADRAVIWSRTDRPARMIVEYATTDSFKDARRVDRPRRARATTDFTARVDLRGLPAGTDDLLPRRVPGSRRHPGDRARP